METNERGKTLIAITIKIIAYRMIPFIVGAFLVLFIAKFLMIKEEIKVCLIFGVFVVSIFAFLEGEKGIKKLKEKCKKLYDIELEKMIDYPYYEAERGFKDIVVGTFGIIKLGSMFYSNNYFQGIYKGVSFRQADVVIQGRSYSDNDDSLIQYFDGRIYEIRSDKIKAQNVKVFSRGYDSRLNVYDYRVDVDNLLFNDNFDVFAPEPSEVQALLTNEMMEHLLILQNRNKSIGFRFAEGLVYVAINGTRPMDLENIDLIGFNKKLAIMKEEIQIAIDLIEGLGLVDEETKS